MAGWSWSESNPGSGVVAEIRAGSSMRSSHAQTVRDGVHAIAVGETGWSGEAGIAFDTRSALYRTEMLAIASQHDSDAAALGVYANALEQIQAEQRSIEAERGAAEEALRALSSRSESLGDRLERAVAQGDAELERATRGELQRNSWNQRTEAGHVSMATARLRLLAERRRHEDAACVAALSGSNSRGGLTSPRSGSRVIRAAGDLRNLSVGDILTLLHTDPAAFDALLDEDPADVARWWSALSLEQQSTLVVMAPTLIGQLNGVPVMVRVAANRLNARDQIAKDRAYLAQWELNREKELEQQARTGAGYDERFWVGQDERMREVRNRIAYLNGALTPDANGRYVQLVLLDVENHRIAEMFGTPGADTRATLVHVPGTFTNLNSFYDGGAQDLPRRIAERQPGTVTFAWKGAPFPGEFHSPSDGAGMALGLSEANDPTYAAGAATPLAGFFAGIQQSHDLDHAASDISGHSWGMAGISAGETEGMRPRNVFSLSGAYVVEDWPRNAENYYHVSYERDILTVGQGVVFSPSLGVSVDEDSILGGLVGGGRAPQYQHDFQPLVGDDFVLEHDTGLGPGETHELVGSGKPENDRVIDEMRGKLMQ